MISPPQRPPWGKVEKSKRVTMPKLLEPPRRAMVRSGLEVVLTLRTEPLATMSS